MSEQTNHDLDVHLENYLKTIWNLSQTREKTQFVKNSEVAELLNVTRPTVTQMLKKFTSKGYLFLKPRYGVKLTAKGNNLAIEIIRKHRLIEFFLHKILHLEGSELHEEAEILEHAVSNRLLEHIDRFLDHPKLDLYGMPVQNLKSSPSSVKINLISMEIGSSGVIASIPDYHKDLFDYILKSGFKVGTKFTVQNIILNEIIEIKSQQKICSIPLKLAEGILVIKK